MFAAGNTTISTWWGCTALHLSSCSICNRLQMMMLLTLKAHVGPFFFFDCHISEGFRHLFCHSNKSVVPLEAPLLFYIFVMGSLLWFNIRKKPYYSFRQGVCKHTVCLPFKKFWHQIFDLASNVAVWTACEMAHFCSLWRKLSMFFMLVVR